MKCISVSDRPSRVRSQGPEGKSVNKGHGKRDEEGSGEGENCHSRALISMLLNVVFVLLTPFYCSAELMDRVVAYVDDNALTLSEFNESYAETKAKLGTVTEGEVIDSMINRVLLLREARKMRLEGRTDDELLKEYIDITITSWIFIKEEEIRKFYEENLDKFAGRDYASLRDEIEKYLTEKETNRRLKERIRELRDNANIAVCLSPG